MNVRAFGSLMLTVVLVACGDAFGSYDNPADPQSAAYGGVYAVTADEIGIKKPADGASGVFLPAIEATKVGNATGYDLQVAHDAAFESLACSLENQAGPTIAADALPLSVGSYFIRVRALAPDAVGPWSEKRAFNIVAPS